MTCGLERSPTWSFLLLFLHFHKIYFSLLHCYTWARQFSLFPCNPIRVKIGSMNCVELLELRRNEKQPKFWPCRLGKQFVFVGPFQWNGTPSFPVLFVVLPPSFLFSLDSFVLFLTLILFFKFLSLFLAISRGGQRCFWDRQWNFSAFRFVCESKRDYETSVYCNYIEQLQDCQGHISCLCSSTNITFLIL